MKRRFRIIVIAFSISFALLAVLSFFSLTQLISLIGFSNWVDQTNRAIVALITVETDIAELDAQEKEYLISKDSSYIQKYLSKYKIVAGEINNLRQLVANNVTQHGKLTMLESSLSIRLNDFKQNLGYYGDTVETTIEHLYNKNRYLREESYSYIKDLINHERILLNQRFQSKKYFQDQTSNTISYLLVFFFVVTVFLFILLIYELRKRIEHENELQQSLVELRNSHSELEQIAYTATHSFQESLRKIKIFGDRLLWLKKGNVDEETKNTIIKIRDTATQMQDYSDEISNLAGLVGEYDYTEPVDLREIIQILKNEYSAQISRDNVIFNADELPEVTGNKKQLYILFHHLLDNALKFRRKDVQPEINISYSKVKGRTIEKISRTFEDNTYHKIEISDNGIGFDNTLRSKIFKAFHKLHVKPGNTGRGVGLTIVKRIITNHHGFIEANGDVGNGATFTIYFPED